MLRIDNANVLANVCALHKSGRVSDRVFHASVVEAVRSGVDARQTLVASGINPSSLPRYASLVSAGFFN